MIYIDKYNFYVVISVCTKNLHCISTLIQIITIWALKLCGETQMDVLDLLSSVNTLIVNNLVVY